MIEFYCPFCEKVYDMVTGFKQKIVDGRKTYVHRVEMACPECERREKNRLYSQIIF